MSVPKRVLFAGLFHETNSFVEGITTLADFSIARGEALLACLGDSSPMGGALAAARQFGWEILPAVDMRALPSGTVADEVFEVFWGEFVAALQQALAGGLDAVYLVLHGAMVSQSLSDVEGELLARLRAHAGVVHLPVFGVFDLHANFTARMAQNADCLVAYRQNPHADAREAAVRAATLLERALQEGVRPWTAWGHPPLVWPPTGTGSADKPMSALLELARELERRHPEFWCVNVVAGFSFADTEQAGVSFTVCTTGAPALARVALELLGLEAWKRRHEGNRVELPASEVVGAALREHEGGLCVIAEPSDNIGGGAPGDGTGLLRTFLELDVPNAALALCDAGAVAQIRDGALAGGELRDGEAAFGCVTLSLGGRGSRLDGGPVTLALEVLSLSDGRFELADKQSHLASVSGDFFDMGPCALVRHRGLTILLTSRPTPPMDLAQWTSQGVDPAALSFIGVKAAVAHRGAYEPIAKRMLWADTPGPCSSRLASFRFERLLRPAFPLDADAAFQLALYLGEEGGK